MNRRFVFATISSVEEFNGDCDFAVVEFTPELAKLILKRAKAGRKMREADEQFQSVSFWDYSVRYYSRDSFEKMMGAEAFEKFESEFYGEADGNYMELPEDVKIDKGEAQRTECDKMILWGFEATRDSPYVGWRATPKHCDMFVEPVQFPLSEVEKFA